MTLKAKNALLFGLAFLVAALAPVGISSKFYLDVLTLIFFTAYIGQSWNILGVCRSVFFWWCYVLWNRGVYIFHSFDHVWYSSYLWHFCGRVDGSIFRISGWIFKLQIRLAWIIFRVDHAGFCRAFARFGKFG